MIYRSGEGHIPSAFSIVDIIEVLHDRVLKPGDRFILSKGHGCAALYVVLEKNGLLRGEDVQLYGTFQGILGGHPDRTKAPVECSTGSLGHGLPLSLGLALGLRITGKKGRVFVLVGDGEALEGTTWESLLVANNLILDGLCTIVDYNGSATQICPHPDIEAQFKSLGQKVTVIDGHDKEAIEAALKKGGTIIAKTVKGKGCKRMETHGPWHHKIPNAKEYEEIMAELDASGVR